MFVIGGLTGAIAGLLFAPKSGRELRGTLAERAGETRERGRETYFEAQESLRERLSESRRTRPEPSEPRGGGGPPPPPAPPPAGGGGGEPP
ncbi:MAG: YtxH domain-containing protein, partial [Actinomycetota bacterium]